jgi:GNAT superfamily N-acetyltransferase
VIRIAGEEDADAIARLLVQLGYPDTTAADALRRLEGITARHDHAVFVDDTNGVAGVIHVCVTETLEHEPRGEIRTLVVDEAKRNAGVGARLVRAAEEWARARGLSKMRVRSNIKRERARRFYERLGYAVTKTQNVFDKLL